MAAHFERDVGAAGPRGSTDASERAGIVRLLCAYVSESLRVTEQWATAHGIHHTDVRALAVLDEASRTGTAITAGRLGTALGLSSPATSALISRLEKAGHLVRTRDPDDRRRVLLTPSPSALAGAVAYFQPMGDALTAALRGFSEEDRVVLDAFLSALVTEMRTIPSR